LPFILAALPARFRYRLATAMLREFFRAWFHPEQARSLGQRLHFGLLYYLATVKVNLPVVPVRLTGLDHVLHRTTRFPTPGPVQVRFDKPMTFTGEDYAGIAGQIERALRDL